MNYLEPVGMSLLGTKAIDTAATTEDAAEEHADDGTRRVRFVLPTDDHEAELRPSDHYGLRVCFSVR